MHNGNSSLEKLVTNRMFDETLGILERNGWDTVQVEDHNPGNWIGNLIHKLKILIREIPEIGLDPPPQYWAAYVWQQMSCLCQKAVVKPKNS